MVLKVVSMLMGAVAVVGLAAAKDGASGALTGLVAVLVLAVSVGGGFWVTTWVLALAQRTEAAEAAEASSVPAPGPDGTPPVPPPPPPAPVPAPPAPGDPAPGDPTGGDPTGGAPTVAAGEAGLRGGTWIGYLERFAVTGLILVGYPAGIAILVAIKGLGRYSELKANTGASERFVVGTLASMVWASGLGVLGLVLIG